MDRTPVLIIQANVNHSAMAQDLLLHTMAEGGYELAVVSEPYRIPKHPNWVGNQSGSVSIIKSSHTNSTTLRVLAQGRGFVLAANSGSQAFTPLRAGHTPLLRKC
ncbi:hypothetical protein QLX08_009353 [Tetragonisca angustula]|uniref:Uncharacterized protein n=1 Tax=Tetragonisca angustula TaxID=166442 RepID=A0AAW0ZGG3_9HYME